MFVNKHPALRLFVCRAPQPALPLLAHALINLTGSGAVSAAPQAAAYLAVSALCTLCALRLLRDAA